MAAFLSAAECGPSNGLKDVGSRLDVDRSLQRDRLISVPNTAGPSSHAFNQHRPTQAPSRSSTRPPANAFDLDSLRRHLSPAPAPQIHNAPPVQRSAPQRHTPTSNWADAFSSQVQAMEPSQQASASAGWGQEFARQDIMQSISPTPSLAPWQRQALSPAYHHPIHHPTPPNHSPHFEHVQQPYVLPPLQQVPQEPQPAPQVPLDDNQEVLARTAQTLLDGVEGHQTMLAENPKLAQSDFMRLLSGISKREVVVKDGEGTAGDEVGEGASFVPRESVSQPGPSTSRQTPSFTPGQRDVHRQFGHYTSLQRADGAIPVQATNQLSQSEWDQRFSDQEALVHAERSSLGQPVRRKSVHFDDGEIVEPLGNGVPSSFEEALANVASMRGTSEAWQETLGDDALDFDEETFYGFNGPMQTARDTRIGVSDLEGWKEMENQWTEHLARMRMKDGEERYLFQRRNPYTAEMEAREDLVQTSPTLKGVLELEAEVQTDPMSHEAWFALGLKQQENEREDQAVLALSKVIQLEPDYRDAYLALAVSYTNEGQKEAANTMLEKWIDLGVQQNRGGEIQGVGSGVNGASYEGRRARLIERLIDLARADEETVDADVQIALGVMFNASEEYDKAEDCFSAALSVRPDDWLLYNRLGATLANSGRSQDAISLYHKALSLHPNFVRALFNLGISYINLAEYGKAAQSLVDALRLQHADATEGYAMGEIGGSQGGMGVGGGGGGKKKGAKGVGSEVLWTTLRNACLHMGRQDLVALTANRDLASFPADLDGGVSTNGREAQ